jgi:hypothetical protein
MMAPSDVVGLISGQIWRFYGMPVAKNTGGGVPRAEASTWMRSGAGMASAGRKTGLTGMNIEIWRSSVARVGGERS